jgi:thioredoxin reductase
MRMTVDVLIIGGGPAGLSAAQVLGRCHRRVLICDEGKQRNLRSQAIHGLLGHEGTSPLNFLARAHSELARYPTLQLRRTRVIDVVPTEGGFAFQCEDRRQGMASKLLIASGIVDELPAVAGVEALYGISVHHCLYCDGFEYRGKAVAAYGKGDKGAELGIVMQHWVSDVVVCSDGTEISRELQGKLEKRGIGMRMGTIARLRGERGQLSQIEFASGPPLLRDGLFFATGCKQASDLSNRLGCKRDEKGGVFSRAGTEESSVPGVYIAGDASRDVLMVSVAIAEGAKAAVTINKALLARDGFWD